MRLSLCFPLLLSLSTTGFAQQLLIVDDDGGPDVDFTDLPAAVTAASPGSTILVRPGTYAPFDLVGKGVSIFGLGGVGLDDVLIPMEPAGAGCRIAEVPAGERAVLSGIRVVSDFVGVADDHLRIEDCEGLVWIQDVDLDPFIGSPFGYFASQQQSLGVFDATRVVLTASRAAGSSGSAGPVGGTELGADGLAAFRSTIDLFDSRIAGGRPTFGGGTGNPGVLLSESVATIHGGGVVGGTGGPSNSATGAPAGQGGTGLQIGPASIARDLGATLEGGIGGGGFFEQGPPGEPATVEVGGSLFTFDVVAATLSAPNVVNDQDEFELDLLGEPAAIAVLFASLDPAPVYLPFLPGTSALGSSPILFSPVQFGAQGGTSLIVGSAPLPAGVEFFSAALQAATVNAQGRVSMTNPVLITVVDDSVL